LYPFSISTLTFNDARLERRYRKWVSNTGMCRDVYIVLATQTLFLYIAHVMLGCMHTERNRAVIAALGAILVLHFLYIHHADKCVRSGNNVAVVYLTYGAMWTLAAFGHEGGCTTHPSQKLYDSEVVLLYSCVFCVSPCFSVDIGFWTRSLLLVVAATITVLWILLRRALIKDEVLVFDFWPVCVVIAFAMVSFFVDLALRNGFQAQMRKRSLMKNRTKHTAISNSALDMMVPAFVVDRLMKNASDRKDIAEVISEKQSGRGSNARDSIAAESDRKAGRSKFNTVAAHNFMSRDTERVWNYRHAVVMFAYFQPPALTYGAISDTIARIEAVASRRGIQKVKTIATTVLLVSGLNPKATPLREAVKNTLECALEIKSKIFPAEHSEGWNFRVGVHVGECFGAVVGNQGLAFDIFGDTVNTASRMQTTAPRFAIQVSAITRSSLEGHRTRLDFQLRQNLETVVIKGKGTMQTFFVERDVRGHNEEDLGRILGRLAT